MPNDSRSTDGSWTKDPAPTPPQVTRWRYVMDGVVPPGVDPARMEGYVRSMVSWNDTMLPFLRGGRVEVATDGQFPSIRLEK